MSIKGEDALVLATESLKELNSKIEPNQWTEVSNKEIKTNLLYRKQGETVSLRILALENVELGIANGYATVGVLPEDCRPIASRIMYAVYNNQYKGQVKIGMDGFVQIGYCMNTNTLNASNLPANAGAYIEISYIK